MMSDEHCFEYNGITAVPENVHHAILHANLVEIPQDAFSYRRVLQTVVFPNSIQIIGERAFGWCSSLVTVVLPQSLLEIQRGAFTNCLSLEEVHIHSACALKTISPAAFSNCSCLLAVTIPSSVVRVERAAFSSCKALRTVIFDSGNTRSSRAQLKVIDSIAFAGCTSLRAIRLPESLRELGRGAFAECTSLLSVELPPVQGFSLLSFASCDNLRNLPLVPENAFDESQSLIQDDLQQAEVEAQNRFGWSQIHIVCYYHSDEEDRIVVESALKQAIRQTPSSVETILPSDNHGMTPFHLLALSKSKYAVDLAELLFRECEHMSLEQAVNRKDKWDRLAIHYACQVDAPMALVRLLVNAHAKSNNSSSPLPWEELIQNCLSSSVTLLRSIIRWSIRHRLERLYLSQWKNDITFSIYQLSNEMNIEAKRAHVESILYRLALLERRETMALLELALWKSVLISKNTTIIGVVDEYSPIEDDEFDEIIPNMEDDMLQKQRSRQDCRIMCGAGVVITNVAPFLGPILVSGNYYEDHQTESN